MIMCGCIGLFYMISVNEKLYLIPHKLRYQVSNAFKLNNNSSVDPIHRYWYDLPGIEFRQVYD